MNKIRKMRNSSAHNLKVCFADAPEVHHIEECKKTSDPVAWFWWAIQDEEEAKQFPSYRYCASGNCWIISESVPESPDLPRSTTVVEDGSSTEVAPEFPHIKVQEPIGNVSQQGGDAELKDICEIVCCEQRLEAPDSEWCDVVLRRLKAETPDIRNMGFRYLLSDDDTVRDVECSSVGPKHGDVILPLALSSHGHPVIMEALAIATRREQEVIISALHGNVKELVSSPFGCEVLQSCVESAVPCAVFFIAKELKGSACAIARTPEKYQLICRLLEHLPSNAMQALVEELLAEVQALCRHPRGNHVVQHLLEYGSPLQQHQICTIVAGDLLNLAKHRIASHVVEKAVDASDFAASSLVAQAALNQTGTLMALACNRQSQFVAQRLAKRGGVEGHLVRCMLCDNMHQLTASKYGSRIADSLATFVGARAGA